MNWLQQIWALTWKDMRLLATDRTALVTLFLLPVLFLLVMSQALSGLYNRSELPRVLVVNGDRGSVATQVIAKLAAAGALRLEAASRPMAEGRLQRREAVAALVFAPDFSDRAKAQTERAPRITLLVDPAAPREVIAPIQGAVRGIAARTLAEVVLPEEARRRVEQAAETSSDPLAVLPLVDLFEDLKVGEVEVVESYPTGSLPPEQRPSSLQQNVPAWTIFGIFFIVNALALSLLRERQGGTFLRLRTAPLGTFVLLAGKLLPFYLINLLQAALMFGLGVGLLGLDIGPHWSALVAVTLATAAVATSLGLLIATFFTSPEQLGGIASVLVVILAALGGILVPGFIMPDALRTLALAIPHRWALEAYQDVLLRGQDLGGVIPEVGVLLLFAVGLFAAAGWRLGRTLLR